MQIAVSALIITDGKLLVQYHNKLNMLALPSGKAEIGETPEQAIAREIAEELGVTDMTIVGEKSYPHHDIRTVEYNYIVTLHAPWVNNEPKKHKWIKPMSPEEILASDIPLAHTTIYALERIKAEQLI